jgi:uncharacterized protein YbaA (DUF1428 family)
VIPIPKKNLGAYKKMAQKASVVWMDHGAVEYWECVGEDLNIKWTMPFTKMCKCKPGETVVFSWIVYKSKAHRDAVNKKVMADPRLKKMMDPKKAAPFDMKKMAYGGFETLVKA